ncbi:MAG TPA: CocE/NonD family hydrolase [Acidimicrobiales bacterium]|nr:CocE/NonD family hydrolase [Acidimicrobiales bacterium]
MRKPTNDVDVERDVKVTVSDGTVLLTDIYHPVGVEDAPTILERTPYGRTNFASAMGPELAARGYRYVLQACRGTDGSAGSHSYFAEAQDGRDTADWIAGRPWFNGSLGTYGASYMGFTQWALASTRPPYLKAMAVALSTSVRSYSWYPGGSLALEVIIPWDVGATQFNTEATAATDVSPEGIERRMAELRAGFDHLPLGEVIHKLTGVDLQLYADQLEHSGVDDPFWQPVSFRHLLAQWTVPTLLVDGWHDYPLPGVVEDYAVLKRSPAPVHLRVGAGGHLGGGGEGGMTDAPLDWFDTWLLGREGRLDSNPVKVHVQGEGGVWRDLEDWPPPAVPTRWYLHPEGRLSMTPPAGPSDPDRYRYDPADPTPSVGGIGMLTGGAVDNRALEARPDVLVYTSDPLREPLEVIGPTEAELWAGSSLDHTDFFVRLCDVHPDGRSVNVCDGLQRFDPASIERGAGGAFTAGVPLWPVGHRFAAGHRLRIQVSSGAHPVYARNLGTGEPPGRATAMRPAEQAVYHEPGRQSFVTLPHFRP